MDGWVSNRIPTLPLIKQGDLTYHSFTPVLPPKIKLPKVNPPQQSGELRAKSSEPLGGDASSRSGDVQHKESKDARETRTLVLGFDRTDDWYVHDLKVMKTEHKCKHSSQG